MPRVRLEPTTPVYGRANTFRALDRAATSVHLIQYFTYSFKASDIYQQ
jgi:hypothetical protein